MYVYFTSTVLFAFVQEGESSKDGDDENDERRGLKSEEYLIRRMMIPHTDYIYTQHINAPS